jgi:phage/plasmid-associated DNA primase
MKKLAIYAKHMNRAPATWLMKLDDLQPGEMPFEDGIVDFRQQPITKRPYTWRDYLTKVNPFKAPGPTCSPVVMLHVETIFTELFSDIRRADMWLRYAGQALLDPATFKHIIQMVGRGDNGKTFGFKRPEGNRADLCRLHVCGCDHREQSGR